LKKRSQLYSFATSANFSGKKSKMQGVIQAFATMALVTTQKLKGRRKKPATKQGVPKQSEISMRWRGKDGGRDLDVL